VTEQPPSPDVRVSDEERERAATRLRDALGEGRLTLEEFSERVDAAYSARTASELEPLTRDLPAPGAAPARTTAPARRPTRSSVAVMSGVERRSRWRVEGETRAVAVMGGVELDLTQAEIVGHELEVTAVAVMGGIEITVPEGVEVDMTGFAFMGGRELKVADVPVLPGSPVIRVRAYAVMGGIEVRSRTAKRLSSGA
jgi:Domain of unknown function (DUF1707)/Cell wall-active antibiotics response 4TMS YvqF